MFALKNKETGEFVGFTTFSTEGDFCTDVVFNLRFNAGNIWVVSKRKIAETAVVTDAPWYNADFETPTNEYVGLLEVVELITKE